MTQPTSPAIKNYLSAQLRIRCRQDPTYAESVGFPTIARWLGCYDLIPDARHQFITIALPNDRPIMSVVDILENVSYQYLEGALARIEYYSESDEDLHVHIYKDGNYSKTRHTRDLARKFSVSPNFVNVKSSNRISDKVNRKNYIKGKKKSKEKQSFVEQDALWRSNNDILEIYNL